MSARTPAPTKPTYSSARTTAPGLLEGRHASIELAVAHLHNTLANLPHVPHRTVRPKSSHAIGDAPSSQNALRSSELMGRRMGVCSGGMGVAVLRLEHRLPHLHHHTFTAAGKHRAPLQPRLRLAPAPLWRRLVLLSEPSTDLLPCLITSTQRLCGQLPVDTTWQRHLISRNFL